MASSVISIQDQTLDNTIKVVSAPAGEFAADNGVYKSRFYQQGNRVEYESKGYVVTWTPKQIKYLDEFGTEDVIYSVQDAPLETKGFYARFNRAYPDIDDLFIAENDRLKHNIVVQGFQRDPLEYMEGPLEFVIGGMIEFPPELQVYAYASKGRGIATNFETDGDIRFVAPNGEVVFTMPQIVAYDSRAENRGQTTGKYRASVTAPGVLEFSVVLDNEWISSLDRVYPVVIDPTVVVASAYDTSGNGGRKIVRLSNNWLVASAYDSTNHYAVFYKSTDNGTTWTQLCFIANVANAAGFAIANIGNKVHVVYIAYEVSGTVRYLNFDATTVANTDQAANATRKQIEFSVNANGIGSGISLAADGAGVLHAVWCAKTTTYTNSFNIRYCKSTDGGATWADPPTHITTVNSAGANLSTPCIIVKSNNYPVIIYQFAGSDYAIMWKRWDGSVWAAVDNNYGDQLYYGGTNPQGPMSAAVDSNDIISVVWQGRDATDNVCDNIRYSKSTDGGATWAAAIKLTVGNGYTQSFPSITIDSNNKIRVIFQGRGSGSYDQIRKIEYDVAWSSIVDLTANTTNNAQNPQTLWSKFNMNSADAVRFIYKDTQAAAVKYDSITLNSPPLAPTLAPKANFDATTAQTLAWTFNDSDAGNTQSAYQELIKRVSDGVTVYDSGKVASTTQSYVLPANTLVNGVQYQRQTRTWDNSDAVGPYSSLATFSTSAKPTAAITVPAADGASVATATSTVEWSFSDPESKGQTAYQLKLTDNADAVLWDSAKTQDANARSRTLGYNLANGGSYKAKLTVWDGDDVASTETVRTFTVSYTPVAIPVLTVTSDSVNAKNVLSWTNPAKTGTEPNPTYVDVYRRKQGDTVWQRIAAGLAINSTYTDYTPADGITYEYKVTAAGDNLTFSDSTIKTGSVTFKNTWLHDAKNPATTIRNFIYDGAGRGRQQKQDVTMMKFAGRKSPVAYFGEGSEGNVPVNLFIVSQADYDALADLYSRRTTVCYRDGRGRKVFGVISALPEQDNRIGWTVALSISEIDYSEEV